jgi:DNA-binding transcriptional LysR family regulator
VELRQLEAFVAVATELHFGRAAERLHVAPPTLSELIRRLERELGTPLFTRTTRQVAMTSAGAELLARSGPRRARHRSGGPVPGLGAESAARPLEAAGISPPTVDLTVALPPGWQTQPDHLHHLE